MRSCYTTWHAYHPKPIAGTLYHYIEEQGPIQAWCGAIGLFATAAKDAGKNLNRRTFVQAMSKITNYPGHALAHLELRAGQVLRPDAVPGGQGAQQRAEVVALQNAEERQGAGHLLGDGAALQAAAGDELGLTGEPPDRSGVVVVVPRGSPHLLTPLACGWAIEQDAAMKAAAVYAGSRGGPT